MAAYKTKIKNKPCGVEPFDKEWNVGYCHKENGYAPYPRVNRLRKFLFDQDFMVDHEGACIRTEAYKIFENEPQAIKCAKVLAHVLKNITLRIYPDELIVGSIGAPMRSAPIYPEYSYAWVCDEIRNYPWNERIHDQYDATEETKQRLLELEDYWKGKTLQENIEKELTEDQLKGSNHGKGVFFLNLYEYGGVGHLTPDFPTILAKGWNGLKSEIENKMADLNCSLPEDRKKREFYKSQLIVLDATIDHINRWAKLARDLASKEENENRRNELVKVAANCEWVAKNPARTFWEALQLLIFADFIIQIEANGTAISYGRWDQWLYPYYENDMKEGNVTKDFIQELIDVLYIKLTNPVKMRDRFSIVTVSGRLTSGDSSNVGGVDENGKDCTNDLTFMMLDGNAHTRTWTPGTAVRMHANTPWELKVKTANVIRSSCGNPKMFNDEVGIPIMLARGRSLKEARTYDIMGCVEPEIPGREYGWHDACYISIVKILEMALNDGKCVECSNTCPRWNACGGVGKQLGPQTGSLTNFKSFDELLEAYEKQMKYWCDLAISSTDVVDMNHQMVKPLPFLSLLVDGCIEKGIDVSAGGAVYNHSGPQANGLGTVVDSLAAIKQLIFDEKRVNAQDYLNALKDNWNGHEALHALVNSDKVHHYGNDDDYADDIAIWVYNCYCGNIEGRINPRGGTYIPGVYSVTANVAFGMMQGATPDGRRSGQPLSDNLGPVHNDTGSHDIYGPTAVAKTVTKLDLERASNGTLLNFKFSPTTVSGETGRDNLINFIDSYFKMKGWHCQFNIINRETLEDAVIHPEKYNDLIVRVAGYSAYFIELDKSLQQDIINRTEFSFD